MTPALPSSAPPVPASASRPMLEVTHVSKSYGATRALTDVSFGVRAGEIVGLLGPNGAGKSTAMKSILGLLRPDAGAIRVLGLDMATQGMAAKASMGYVPEAPALYEFLTGAEYLDFVSDLYGVPSGVRADRIRQFLTGLELAGHEDALISGYSQGMKQKVALISALLHHPRLLVLDEPLNGLDPRAARVVKDLLRSLATTEGVGVVFSTHVLEIAEAICDRVVILRQGQVIAEGTVADLRQRAGLPGSGLEEVFLSITGTGDLGEVVSALRR